MTNYTTETYQMKRDILNYTNKISNGTRKPIIKLTQDMTYGISRSKNCLLSVIARDLKEDVKVSNTIDRLSNRLSYIEDDEKEKIKNNYYNLNEHLFE